jgi:hypothetical protein
MRDMIAAVIGGTAVNRAVQFAADQIALTIR